MTSYTEDHLVEQPAVQLMQHELGWEVEGNIEHRTPNIEHRSEEWRKTWRLGLASRFGGAGLFVRNLRGLSNPLTLSEFLFNKKTSA